MKVKVFAKNSGGESQESPTTEVKVVTIDSNKIEYLSYEDYLSVISKSSTYNKKFAYWCAKVSKDAYSKVTNKAMQDLNFKTITSLPIPEFSLGKIEITALNGFIGHTELDKGINGISFVVMISIRGTEINSGLPTFLNNLLKDISAAPINWKTGKPTTIGNPITDGVIELIDNVPEAHGGIYFCTNKILEKIQTNPTYSKYLTKHNKNTLFIVTGHSLGGAIAELLCLKLCDIGVPSNNIISYGFASPPVADKDLWKYSNDLGLSSQIHKIMNTEDIVPTLGFFAYTLANDVQKFKDSQGDFLANHNMEKVYMKYVLGTLEKVYCEK